MNITDVLDQIGSDVLTADTKKALAEAFTEAVEKRIAEQSELTATDAL